MQTTLVIEFVYLILFKNKKEQNGDDKKNKVMSMSHCRRGGGGTVVDQNGEWGVNEGSAVSIDPRDSKSGMSLVSSDASSGCSSELVSRES